MDFPGAPGGRELRGDPGSLVSGLLYKSRDLQCAPMDAVLDSRLKALIFLLLGKESTEPEQSYEEQRSPSAIDPNPPTVASRVPLGCPEAKHESNSTFPPFVFSSSCWYSRGTFEAT